MTGGRGDALPEVLEEHDADRHREVQALRQALLGYRHPLPAQRQHLRVDPPSFGSDDHHVVRDGSEAVSAASRSGTVATFRPGHAARNEYGSSIRSNEARKNAPAETFFSL